MDMTFESTKGASERASFKEAVFKGLAPDGGLFHPTEVPDLSSLFLSFDEKTDFNLIAEKVTYNLLKPEISRDSARKIVKRAFTFTPHLCRVDENISILELYHGPSHAFKDFGASFLASCMEEFLSENNERAIILVATSGDTGSAVARAFLGRHNIDVVILYPSGRVSLLQEKQLTTLGGNITSLEVKGAFDDCQKLVKDAFVDPALTERLRLTSANSINLGRLIPQAYYYVYAYAQMREALENGLFFCVPCGNFGNITAGVYAWTWGLPVKRFIMATNVNDVVPQYLYSGVFTPRASIKTLSNAMDVGDPSNLERLNAVFDFKVDRMRSLLHTETVTDEDTLDAIRSLWKESGIFIDPHTAVGYVGARRYLESHKDARIIVLSTAHPAKFRETVEKATGVEPELPEGLREAMDLPKRSTLVENNLDSLRSLLLERFG
jgi:threonine synthase